MGINLGGLKAVRARSKVAKQRATQPAASKGSGGLAANAAHVTIYNTLTDGLEIITGKGVASRAFFWLVERILHD